jgi:hypothetical protein
LVYLESDLRRDELHTVTAGFTDHIFETIQQEQIIMVREEKRLSTVATVQAVIEGPG